MASSLRSQHRFPSLRLGVPAVRTVRPHGAEPHRSGSLCMQALSFPLRSGHMWPRCTWVAGCACTHCGFHCGGFDRCVTCVVECCLTALLSVAFVLPSACGSLAAHVEDCSQLLIPVVLYGVVEKLKCIGVMSLCVLDFSSRSQAACCICRSRCGARALVCVRMRKTCVIFFR